MIAGPRSQTTHREPATIDEMHRAARDPRAHVFVLFLDPRHVNLWESLRIRQFDAFIDRYNQERPHQALGMKVPADVYTRSPRPYRGLEARLSFARLDGDHHAVRPDLLEPPQDQRECGLRGQVSDRIWLVSFMDYDLGYFDDETCRLEPIANPFAAKVLPMAPE